MSIADGSLFMCPPARRIRDIIFSAIDRFQLRSEKPACLELEKAHQSVWIAA
jgi:hypothetical protein